MAFFVSRYFGMKEYAKLYGVMLVLFSLANGVGPALSGLSFDYFHSYTQIFIVYEILLVIACTQFLGLGPYLYPARDVTTKALVSSDRFAIAAPCPLLPQKRPNHCATGAAEMGQNQ